MFCTPFWRRHRWLRWSVTRRVEVLTQYTVYGVKLGEPMRTGGRMYQERECSRCGCRQTRSAEA